MEIRTRFAPSPTGSLHLGSIRTAYYSWLYAIQNNGTFEIRIEDTDAARSSEEYTKALLEDLAWFGIKPQRIVYQSQNIARHLEIASQLETTRQAYRCYLTQEQLTEMRTTQNLIRSPYRDPSLLSSTGATNPTQNFYHNQHLQKYTLRFRMPKNTTIVLRDRVQGTVTVNTDSMDDPIILRSDRTPTYIFACMVDDHDAETTHIIRGTEHLSNTLRQLPIYQALNWPTPQHAHIPIVQDPKGNKLSKRNTSQSIKSLQSEGYLPQAILNTVLRTGWSCGDEEIFDVPKALKLFSLEGLNKSPARFDPAKLDHLNNVHMRLLNPNELWKMICQSGMDLSVWTAEDITRAKGLFPEITKRAVTLVQLVENLQYCRAAHLIPKVDFFHAGQVTEILERLDFTEENLERSLRDLTTTHTLNFAQDIAQPLRLALTGSKVTPGLFVLMVALGKELVLKRIAQCIQHNTCA